MAGHAVSTEFAPTYANNDYSDGLLYTTAELAYIIGVNHRTIARRADRLDIGTRTGGGHWRFTHADYIKLRDTRDRRYGPREKK